MFLLTVILGCAPAKVPFEGKSDVVLNVAGQSLNGVAWVKEPDQLHLAIREPITGRVLWRMIEANGQMVVTDLVHQQHIISPNLPAIVQATPWPRPTEALWTSKLDDSWDNAHKDRWTLHQLTLTSIQQSGLPPKRIVLSNKGTPLFSIDFVR